MSTPRCFILRHGETEWSLSGKHTGISDIPLTADGEKRVRATGKALVGKDRLIVPSRLAHIYVSPRHRAQRTVELLDLGCPAPYPWSPAHTAPSAQTCAADRTTHATVSVTPLIAEWNYGDYEGITSAQIRQRRKQAGQAENWDIWTEGCPGGEGPGDVVARVDELIAKIRARFHGPAMRVGADGSQREKDKDKDKDRHVVAGDVMVVAHGHILRAFAMRWIGKPLAETHFIMEAGGVGTLSYEHHSIEEPAIVLGGAFVVGDVEEEVEREEREGKIK